MWRNLLFVQAINLSWSNASTGSSRTMHCTRFVTRADMIQAVLEGIAFVIRDSCKIAKPLGMEIRRRKLYGGGAKSLLWHGG